MMAFSVWLLFAGNVNVIEILNWLVMNVVAVEIYKIV